MAATSSSEKTRSPQIFVSRPPNQSAAWGRSVPVVAGTSFAKGWPRLVIASVSPALIHAAMTAKLFLKSATFAVFMRD